MEEWKTLQVTIWARAKLEEEIEELKNDWAVGSFSDESIEKSGQLNAQAIGTLQGLFIALDLLTKDEEEEMEGET